MFTITARNSANLVASDKMKIRVVQHPAERTFVHRFMLQLRPEFDEEQSKLPEVNSLVFCVSKNQVYLFYLFTGTACN